jgi:hypothetical protein
MATSMPPVCHIRYRMSLYLCAGLYTPVVISKSFQPHYGSIAIKGKVIRECVPPRNCESHLHFRANGDGSCTANEGTAGANITCLDMQFSSWGWQLNGHRDPETSFGLALFKLSSHCNSEYLHNQRRRV